MAEIAKWNNHTFEVSPGLIRGFTGLQIKGSSETEDKEISKEKFVTRKNAKPTEISLTVGLNALLGCDVRNEAMQFIADAKAGETGYFYIGNKKLVTCQLMLTEAGISETQITAKGTWVSAQVQLSFKQASKDDGTTSAPPSPGGGGGYSGGSSGSTIGAAIGAVAGTVAAAAAAAAAKVAKTIQSAKKATQKGVGGGSGVGRAVMCIK